MTMSASSLASSWSFNALGSNIQTEGAREEGQHTRGEQPFDPIPSQREREGAAVWRGSSTLSEAHRRPSSAPPTSHVPLSALYACAWPYLLVHALPLGLDAP